MSAGWQQQEQFVVGLVTGGSYAGSKVHILNECIVALDGTIKWVTRATDGAGYTEIKKLRVRIVVKSEESTGPKNKGEETTLDKENIKKKNVCRFFASPTGCREGVQCNFSHMDISSSQYEWGHAAAGSGGGGGSGGSGGGDGGGMRPAAQIMSLVFGDEETPGVPIDKLCLMLVVERYQTRFGPSDAPRVTLEQTFSVIRAALRAAGTFERLPEDYRGKEGLDDFMRLFIRTARISSRQLVEDLCKQFWLQQQGGGGGGGGSGGGGGGASFELDRVQSMLTRRKGGRAIPQELMVRLYDTIIETNNLLHNGRDDWSTSNTHEEGVVKALRAIQAMSALASFLLDCY